MRISRGSWAECETASAGQNVTGTAVLESCFVCLCVCVCVPVRKSETGKVSGRQVSSNTPWRGWVGAEPSVGQVNRDLTPARLGGRHIASCLRCTFTHKWAIWNTVNLKRSRRKVFFFFLFFFFFLHIIKTKKMAPTYGLYGFTTTWVCGSVFLKKHFSAAF